MALEQLGFAAKESKNLRLKVHAKFSGALAWPYMYPRPQRPAGLVETAFAELAKRWRPILDVFDRNDVDLCYEVFIDQLKTAQKWRLRAGLRLDEPAMQFALRSEPLCFAAAQLQ